MFTFVDAKTFEPVGQMPFVPNPRVQDEWLWVHEEEFLKKQRELAELFGLMWSYRPKHRLFSSAAELGSCTKLWNRWYPKDDIPF